MRKFTTLLLLVAASAFAGEVAPPPRELVESWKLASFYTKCITVEGLPVLGSAKASDFALAEAAFLIRKMIGHRPDILHAMAANHVRFVVMAPSEMTTDIPEHSDLTPRAYWNRRARGLGATPQRPAVSCGEENLLGLPGDPYATENILIHEFSHAIHERGLSSVDPTFDRRLQAAYDHARTAGLWKGTYAMQNRMEYWAEAAQSWFDCNRVNDNEHGPIDTREKLKPYDPQIAALLTEIYGDTAWRYTKPAQRPAAERTHLAGFEVEKAGRFAWPKEAPEVGSDGELIALLPADRIPSASPPDSRETSILFVNHRARPVDLEWIGIDGTRKAYANIRPGFSHLQHTFTGHAWIVLEDGKPLGAAVAVDAAGRVEIK
jgi:hypothetical protein